MQDLTQKQVDQVEKDFGVYVDAESAKYHTVGPDEDFGWKPIPDLWVNKDDVSKHCPACQAVWRDNAKFCGYCGAKLEEYKAGY
jgi:NADH pyrophosphatase NudC (nudix superfamily)